MLIQILILSGNKTPNIGQFYCLLWQQLNGEEDEGITVIDETDVTVFYKSSRNYGFL